MLDLWGPTETGNHRPQVWGAFSSDLSGSFSFWTWSRWRNPWLQRQIFKMEGKKGECSRFSMLNILANSQCNHRPAPKNTFEPERMIALKKHKEIVLYSVSTVFKNTAIRYCNSFHLSPIRSGFVCHLFSSPRAVLSEKIDFKLFCLHSSRWKIELRIYEAVNQHALPRSQGCKAVRQKEEAKPTRLQHRPLPQGPLCPHPCWSWSWYFGHSNQQQLKKDNPAPTYSTVLYFPLFSVQLVYSKGVTVIEDPESG